MLSFNIIASWPFIHPGTLPQQVPQNSVLTLSCGSGGLIESIDDAAYGTPLGGCATGFSANSQCNSNQTLAVLGKACLSKESCSVTADDATFGNLDCGSDSLKNLIVRIKCSNSPAISVTVLPP